MPVRWVEGKLLPETGPYRLLAAAAELLRRTQWTQERIAALRAEFWVLLGAPLSFLLFSASSAMLADAISSTPRPTSGRCCCISTRW